MRVEYIIWHTAADPREQGKADTSAAEIDRWHRNNGWLMIGYHYVVRRSGTIERGRPETVPGAHAEGLNTRSIGICLSGHGDLQPLTPAQLESALKLTVRLLKRYGLPVHRVIGHREINKLVEAGTVPKRYRVYKSCPGALVDMSEIRKRLMERLEHDQAKTKRSMGVK